MGTRRTVHGCQGGFDPARSFKIGEAPAKAEGPIPYSPLLSTVHRAFSAAMAASSVAA